MVDSYDDWAGERSEERGSERLERRSSRRPEPRLEQRLDQWVTAGRQLVDGVSGARPGARSGARSPGLRLDHLGRWVEDKLDWLLEDEDGWREAWEQPAPQRSGRRQPLEAISRRRPTAPSAASASVAPPPADEAAWPDDDSFTLNRWQRGASAPPPAVPPAPRPQSGRTLPRSSRRRAD